MKKLLIVSDTHGAVDALKAVIEQERPFDGLFYLGDGYLDLEKVRANVVCIYHVRGNCDYGCAPNLGRTEIDGVSIFYTHGHLFGAKVGPYMLVREGLDRKAEVVLFGHTHRPALEYENDPAKPTLFNPGSLRDGDYGILTIEDGKPRLEHRRLG